MPKTETILKIFVSSPSDVTNEKSVVVEVIEETNRTWADFLGTRLEPVLFETHCRPGVGDDAQQVVNGQLPAYDVYLGILWKRFGTPTPRFGSGTEEEFEIAYKQYKQDSTNIGIMFYFKDELVHPSEIDPIQLASVNEFRRKLGPKGVLHWGFESIGEFRQLIRIHLSKELQQHTSKSASEKNCTPDLDSLSAESEKQAFALLKIIEQHYTALGEHEEHLEKTDNFDAFLNATDLLCDKLEPTVGAFVKHVNYTVEAWINEFIALILTKSATSDVVNSYQERLTGLSREFREQSVRYAHHLDVPEDVLKDNSEDAKAVIEIFRELEQRQGELFSVISEDLAAAADIFDEAIRVIDLLTRRTTSEIAN
jgi:hypothetical protein